MKHWTSVRRIALATLIWAGICTAVACLRGLQDVLQLTYTHQSIDWTHVFGERLLQWYTAGAVIPLYVWLVRYLQRYALGTAVTVAIYALAIGAGFILDGLLYIPLENAIFHGGASFALGFAYDAFSYSFGNAAIFAAIIAVERYRLAKEHDLRAARLESQLADARLQTLRAQLDPHFLFNTLNSVCALIREDPRAAEEMIARLAELLRVALDSSTAREVPLGAELRVVRAYLAIMGVRYGERLRYAIDVPDELLDAQVPNFVLQPLVENAIRHGMPARGTLHVHIEAQAAGDAVRLLVRDDGAGLPGDGARREGIGLRNVRARLSHLYGARSNFQLEPAIERGTQAMMTVPRAAAALHA